MSKKQSKKLSEFLKEHNAYDSYVKQFDYEFFRDEVGDIVLNLGTAFIWDESNEGFDYWNRLNDLWLEFPNKEYDMDFLIENQEKGGSK